MYQHSAVGRDLLVELLTLLGAEVIPAGRSETFVPIDTENIDAEQLGVIQSLLDEVVKTHGPIDAVVSIDGDSDRPLLLGINPAGKVHFFPGDLVGMIVAEYLGADAVVVPISCNDAIDYGNLAPVLEPKTRIGSPYVIAGMEQAVAKGRERSAAGRRMADSCRIGPGQSCHPNPNQTRHPGCLSLPITCVLFAAQAQNSDTPRTLRPTPETIQPRRPAEAFPRATSLKILEQLSVRPAVSSRRS